MIDLKLNRNFNKQKVVIYFGVELWVPDHGFIALKKDTTFDDENHYIVVWYKHKPEWNRYEGWFDLSQVSRVIAEVQSNRDNLSDRDLEDSLRATDNL